MLLFHLVCLTAVSHRSFSHGRTASQCDLRDPGWGDPGSLHCDFFAWHLSAHPMMFLVCPSVASMDGLLGTRHISCLVIALFTSSSRCFHFTVFVVFCGCGLFLFAGWFCVSVSFCCGCFFFLLRLVFVSRFSLWNDITQLGTTNP